MAMSDAPTYGEVSPDAMVDTITLGTPTGSLRMPAVAIAVPPDPPMEKTPSKRPLAYSVGKSFSTPRVMVSVAKARSFFSAMVDISISTAAATSVLVTSGMVCGSNTPAVDGDGVDAQLFEAGFNVGEFFALGVKSANNSNSFHVSLPQKLIPIASRAIGFFKID